MFKNIGYYPVGIWETNHRHTHEENTLLPLGHQQCLPPQLGVRLTEPLPSQCLSFHWLALVLL